MRNKLGLYFVVAALSVFLAAGVASAHHGTASYDKTRLTTLKGTVTDFMFKNPHGAVDFDVKDSNGNVEKWEGFLTSPNWLTRAGWTKNTLKPGDMITLIGNQSKNRPNSIWITKVLLANGQELVIGGLENIQ